MATIFDEVTDLGTIEVVGKRRTDGSGFSLSTFMSEINNNSILKASRYLMQFTLPKGLVNVTNYGAQEIKKIILRCDASVLPGVSFAETEEIRRYGVGPTEKHPYLPIFGPISASYIVDGNGVIHNFFYDWLSYIVGFDSSQGLAVENTYGHSPYEVAYKDDYVSQVTIIMYNEKNDRIIEVTLNNAYPISIEPIPLSWGDESLAKLNVTWDYTDWSAKYYSAQSGGLLGNINALKNLTDIANKLSGVSNNFGFTNGVKIFSQIASKTQTIDNIKNLVSGGVQNLLQNTRRTFGI